MIKKYNDFLNEGDIWENAIGEIITGIKNGESTIRMNDNKIIIRDYKLGTGEEGEIEIYSEDGEWRIRFYPNKGIGYGYTLSDEKVEEFKNLIR